MLRRTGKKLFRDNTDAISEEFTLLPALSLVMIGIVLFSVLTLSAYESYGAQTNQLSKIDVARYVLSKIVDTDQCYMREGQIIDITYLDRPELFSFLNDIKHDLYPSGIDFSLLLSYENTSTWVLDEPQGEDSIAVSQPIGIAINPVDVTSGTVTLVVWDYKDEQV